MSFTTLRRAARSALVLIALSTLWPGMPGVAQAAVPIADVGSHGTYKITDSPARPGARCRYEGTAGTWYLQRIRVAAPTIFGSSAEPSRSATDSSSSGGLLTAGRPRSVGR